jgi:hypothetical protein
LTSTLVTQLVEREGLLPLLASRERGVVPRESEVADVVARAQILAVGAAADAARRRECGDETRIHIPTAPPPTDALVVIGADTVARGTALLRHIALLRLGGPIALRIVVDFGALGLEIAQVALSFGATDLAGPILSRRGLPILDRDDPKKLVKRREIAGYVERAGFRPVFVTAEAHSDGRGTPPESASRANADS